ncbi:nitroreductase family deazaflavin-dependent oxidoreductase [Mycolicibacterium goodii]|uniref:nitroreductase family deazaflavin-dependent oxidoreductase n=1 Tax=Mycolicibacterium goodii TaxID=134601 RepID=UPI001BDCA243|nr:nitroreductase family deazaflavin-dependent oxidoreductase [Mycolicibacterium goodii]MBU8812029.1 nitroreductase family deazaflavin-dependent oxidoreductase [Mycolicibacterium goodii]
MKITKQVQPPTGLSRLLFRAPLAMYKARLGWVFGNRILLLHHIGRVTGKDREVVLEVVEHDPSTGAYTVASGWGTKAAWYRNVLAKPEVTIEVGRQTVAVTAVPLSQAEGADVFARYAMRHRILARYLLPRLMGFSVDGSVADFRAAGEQIPFIRFVPRAA